MVVRKGTAATWLRLRRAKTARLLGWPGATLSAGITRATLLQEAGLSPTNQRLAGLIHSLLSPRSQALPVLSTALLSARSRIVAGELQFRV